MVSWCFMFSIGLLVSYGPSSQVNVKLRHPQGMTTLDWVNAMPKTTKPRRWLKNQKGNKAVVEESKRQQGGGWRIKEATSRWLKNRKEVTQTIKTGCCVSWGKISCTQFYHIMAIAFIPNPQTYQPSLVDSSSHFEIQSCGWDLWDSSQTIRHIGELQAGRWR